MAQYDVHPNPGSPGFLLDVQSDLLDALNTRVVVPLLPRDQAPAPARRLNPEFTIDGQPTVMATQFLAAVPRAILSTPVANLKDDFAAITAAIDMITHGY